MRIVALEEHVATPDVISAWQALPADRQDIAVSRSIVPATRQRLLDLGSRRIAAMDAAGVDVQVLSLTTPGVQALAPDVAIPLAAAVNDSIATMVWRWPDRFQGFATLPTSAPPDAARELRRAVVELGLDGAMIFGRTGTRNFDHPDFRPILETAAELRAPIYLHPQSPQAGVREAYYADLGDPVTETFATAGIGWHYETGIQALRLVLSGVFDRLPDLQLILGHWGEVVLFFLERIDKLTAPAGLARPVSDYFRTNVSVTPGGILSQRYLAWAIEVLGSERILFATDYPFEEVVRGGAREFLQSADINETDRQNISSGNWERLRAQIKRQFY